MSTHADLVGYSFSAVMDTNDENRATQKLAEGWRLIAVFSEQTGQWRSVVRYVLAKPKSVA